MNKPILLKRSEINQIKGNEKRLLAHYGYKTIYDAKHEISGNAKEVYQYLFNEVNKEIRDDNERFKKNYLTKKAQYEAEQAQTRLELSKKKMEEKKSIRDAIKKMKTVEYGFGKKIKRTTYKKEALNGMFKEFYIFADDLRNGNTLTDVMQDKSFTKQLLYSKIANELKNNLNPKFKLSIRVFIVIKYLMFREVVNNEGKTEIEYAEHFYNAPIRNIVSNNNIQTYINDVFHEFYEKITNPQYGSDWRFKKFLKYSVGINKYKSVMGSSFIKLPTAIANKKACINIKNNDQKCFLYCLLADTLTRNKIIESKDLDRPSIYKNHTHHIKVPENVEYPITTDDISEFEELNNIQINVFELENYTEDVDDVRTCIREVYKSNQHRKNVVNLLMIREGETSHYVYIKNLSRLFASKTLKKSKHFCPHCLTKAFFDTELLEKHIDKCASYSESEKKVCDVEIQLPESDSNLEFKNEGNKFKHPFHVVADFESTLCPYNDDSNNSTKKYQKHKPNSVGLKYCSIHKEHDESVKIFNSPNPDEVCKYFIETLEEYAKKSYKMLQLNKRNIIWKENEKENFYKNIKCENCGDEYTDKNKQVAHHNHITGEFISSLCNSCNLKFQYKPFLPVYLHNLKGYDSHLFISALNKYGSSKTEITCIPNNEEKYISFTKTIKVDEYKCKKDGKIKPINFDIRFLDTIAFMNSSIETLVENLSNGCDTIEKLRNAFPNTSAHFKDDTQFKLMTQKGVYPYDYIDDYNKLNSQQLPHIQAFYSNLYGSDCSLDDYAQAQTVWKTFQCKTFLDYHNLYLCSDVLLLTDVWENFRNTCYTHYNLDCIYYYTAPGLSFDAMLKHTKIKLELLSDIEMYEFCESGIRGGLSQISKRHAAANNKYMQNYDSTKADSSILYLDANNLYGWSMSQYLPTKDFKWCDDVWSAEKIMNIADDADTGYMFEVDLHIPENLHDYFNNYVPCPDNVQVLKEDLNGWQQEKYKQSKIRKLCCSFKDKIGYVVNYRYLKLVLSLGVELRSVGRVLQFTQTQFLKKYIDLNTDLRKDGKNDFEKDFFKLMNNSVFGKTMENVRQRINFRLINTDEQAWRVKNLKKFTIFDDELVGVHIQKTKITLNKPVYLGQTILDDSKFLMYDFHYNFMLKKIERKNIDLLFTDTDSLCYHIKNVDVFDIMKNNKDYFDLSNYPKNHPLYDGTNNKVIGKFKNESVVPITEFAANRAKSYAYTVDGDNSKHLKCKGVKKSVSKKTLDIEMYKDVLFNRCTKSVKQNGIRSVGHQLYTETITKTALSGNDDKVFICDDNVNTRNFGHYLNQ
jgi:hypothetical protein